MRRRSSKVSFFYYHDILLASGPNFWPKVGLNTHTKTGPFYSVTVRFPDLSIMGDKDRTKKNCNWKLDLEIGRLPPLQLYAFLSSTKLGSWWKLIKLIVLELGRFWRCLYTSSSFGVEIGVIWVALKWSTRVMFNCDTKSVVTNTKYGVNHMIYI